MSDPVNHSATPSNTPTAPGSPGFPDEHALCEQCGYALRGLDINSNCPECGTPIFNSDPLHRTGLPWQRKPSTWSFLSSSYCVALHPRSTFGCLQLGPTARAPGYLLRHALVLGLFIGLCVEWFRPPLSEPTPVWSIFLMGMGYVLGIALVFLLCSIESFGVMMFSKRRGWRVPWRRAFQVCCYASVGWWVTALIWVKVLLVYHHTDWVDRALDPLAHWRPVVEPVLWILLIGVSFLPFELLVWTGVRAVRYGNEIPQTLPQPSTTETGESSDG